MTTTLIRGRWIVAFQEPEHRLLRDGVVVYDGDRIVHVGRSYAGPVDREVDARRHLVMPGLISTHTHIGVREGDRLILDGGRRDNMRSGFLNFMPRRRGGAPGFLDRQDLEASLRFGLALLAKNGVTTVLEMGGGGQDGGATMTRLAGESGLRLYYSPFFSAGDYEVDADGRLHIAWDERRGLEQLERACRYIEENRDAFEGRVKGILVLNEFFLSTPDLRRRAKAAARALGVGLTLHVAEQLYEFHDTVRATGRTPVGVLDDEGMLGPDVILGHCLYVAGHSMTAYPYRGDLAAVARSGCTVAHAPLTFARRGVALESFQRYLDAGINLALGTDTYPMDLLSEMRVAALMGKVTTQNHEAATARDVFNAATLGGARALGREDLGRLARGATADIVLVDFANLTIGPVHDPIRALVHLATAEMIDTVVVAGRTLVEGKRLLVCDESRVLQDACVSTEGVWNAFPQAHWSGRPVDETFPPSLAPWMEPDA